MILLIWLLMQRGVRAFSYLSSRYPHSYISYAIASLFLRLDNSEYIILNQERKESRSYHLLNALL